MRLVSDRYRPWVVYSGCTLIALAILTSNLKGGASAQNIESFLLILLTPLHYSMDWSLDNVSAVWNHYIYLKGLKEENLKLKYELDAMRMERTRLIDSSVALERYKQLLGFSRQFPHRKINANVVKKTNKSWNSTLLIDTGSLLGVKPAMGVATVDGVFGQVVRVGPHISKVLSLLHPNTGIAAVFQKSRVQGIVSGTARGTCVVNFVSRFDRIILGEAVLTSGLDGAFPKNVPIGQVAKIEKTPSEIFQRIEIIPFVDVTSVEEVTVFLLESDDVIE